MKQFRDTPYYVTENGEVYSNFNGQLKKRKPVIDKYGYYKLTMYHNRKKFDMKVHRLVAICFIPNPNDLPMVEHLDDNKLNNHVSNLEWVTDRENKNRAIKSGLFPRGENNHKSKLTEQDIIWIKKHYVKRHPNYNSEKLSQKFNVSRQTICRIVNNQLWKHLNPEQS